MRDEVAIALLILLVIASSGAGYFVGNTSGQTVTTTETTQSITTATYTQMVSTPANVTVCEGIGTCGQSVDNEPQFSVRYNLSVAVASASNIPPSCQMNVPKTGSYIELKPNSAVYGSTIDAVTFWISNQVIKQSITSGCTVGDTGQPEYLVEMGMGDFQAHGDAAFAMMLNMSDCLAGVLPVACGYQLYAVGTLNPAA